MVAVPFCFVCGGTLTGYVAPIEAARKLGVSRGRVGQLMREGQIQTVMTPLGRLVSTRSLGQLMRQRAAKRGEARNG